MNTFNKLKYSAVALLIPFLGFSQEQVTKSTSTYFSNALFLTLLVTIIALAAVIVAFGNVFKNIADSNFLINKYGKKKDNDNEPRSSGSATTVISIVLILSSFSMMAQEKASTAVKDDGLIGGLDQFTFYFMVFIILVELMVLGLMFYQFNFLVKTQVEIKK